MASTPKLEFYRIKLNPKKDEFKTFKDFVKEELGGSKFISDDKALEVSFKHFIKSLGEDFAKDDKLKKQLTLIKKRSVNLYLEKQPNFNSATNIISGVINGGPFGRDKIISNIDDQEDSEGIGRNKSVLQYFYFLLYLPMDHNEGCFIIHSNSSDESITVLFRNYISNIFKGSNYNKVAAESFCPQSFQDEFKDGAIIKSLTFKQSFVEGIHATNAVAQLLQEYDIKIEATPKKGILVTQAEVARDFFAKKIFGTQLKAKTLAEFAETKITTENELTKVQKVFEWNTRDLDFVPVVYLNNRINKTNADGTPDFDELRDYCLNLFNDEILHSIRPDLNARKHP